LVETDGSGKIPDEQLCKIARQVFPLTPGGIIKYLDLRRPIYRLTASGGHFGRCEPEFTWEKTNRVDDLLKAAK
jgi:S-adenosylmethionine synthetase